MKREINAIACKCHYTNIVYFTDVEGLTTLDMSPEREAHYLIRKIRRQVRLVNRKWAEINQSCNEWQSQIDEVLEVR